MQNACGHLLLTVDEKRSHQGKSLSVSVFLYGKEDVLAKYSSQEIGWGGFSIIS